MTNIELRAILAALDEAVPCLRARAAETESLRQLLPETVADIKRLGFARLFQPARFGGAEAPLEAMVAMLSALARGCASTAWVIAQHMSHNLLLALWPEAAQQRIWGDDPATLISGSLAAGNGKGRRVAGGYMLAGHWPWASGVNTCDWGLFAALTEEHGGAIVNRHYLVPRSAFGIVDVWHAVGLRGTSSNDVHLEETFVAEEMTLALDQMRGGEAPGTALNTAPLYKTPSYMMFGVVQGSVCVGMAEAALEVYRQQVRERVALMSQRRVADYPTQQAKVATAAAAATTARATLLDLCRGVTAMVEQGLSPASEDRARSRAVAAYAGRIARDSVEALWDAAGGGGIYDANPLSRIFRDMSAASRHFTMNWDPNAITYGRALMGLDTDNPAL